MRHLITFYSDAFKIALDSILAHKLRALLTLIGVVIGVAAVVVVGASISGLNSYVTKQVGKMLGANHFMMSRIATVGQLSEEEFERMNRRNKRLSWDDFEYLKANCQACSEVGAGSQANGDLNQDGIEMPATRIIGATANMELIEDKTIVEGRFFNDAEVLRSAKVCVIGADVREKYFGDKDPIGQKLKVQGIPLDIIGVEEKKGSFLGMPMDRNVYIPVRLHMQMFGFGNGVQVHGKAEDREKLTAAIADARTDLRNRRHLIGSDEDNFGLINTDEVGSQIDQFTGAIAVVVMPITMITLIVGGIVVMNIMLVSVTERTFEVGLRKALGATQKQIILQFLIESVLLCAVGGLIGILVAVGVTQLITVMAEIAMNVTLLYVVGAFVISSTIGIISGIYPAYKAAKLDPIIALTASK
jgi:putative ABC transport system permease protein